MAEVKNYVFDYKEVAAALVKQQGIHEGLWGIYMQFGILGTNMTSGPPEERVLPAAIVPVLKIGIQQFDKPSSLTVDAAEVNPRPLTDSSSRRHGRAGRSRTGKREEQE